MTQCFLKMYNEQIKTQSRMSELTDLNSDQLTQRLKGDSTVPDGYCCGYLNHEYTLYCDTQ